MVRLVVSISFLFSAMAFAGKGISIDEKLSRISLESDNCFEKAVSTLEMNECGGIKL